MSTRQSIWAYTCESSPVSRLLNLYPHVGSVSSNINVLSIHKGEPTISRLLKIIGLFCRISSVLYSSFAKETYQFKEPTKRSHPILTTAQEAYKPSNRLHIYIQTSPVYIPKEPKEPYIAQKSHRIHLPYVPVQYVPTLW